jgi:hypothetical protein
MDSQYLWCLTTLIQCSAISVYSFGVIADCKLVKLVKLEVNLDEDMTHLCQQVILYFVPTEKNEEE